MIAPILSPANWPAAWRKLFLALCLVFIGVMAFGVQPAHAQATDGSTYTLDQVQAAAGSSSGATPDQSRSIYKAMLGDFGDDPFGQIGKPVSTLLGSIFFVFNSVLFTIGAGYIGWTALTQIVVSANAGEVLGRQMSGVWLPVRIGIGAFGMLPAFGGFSLAQAVMMSMAILGIGMANLVTQQAISETAQFQGVIPPPGISGPNDGHTIDNDIGNTLFKMHVCTMAANEYGTLVNRALNGTFQSPDVVQGSYSLYSKGTIADCGSVNLTQSQLRSGDNSFLGVHSGYRTSAVNYSAIANVATGIRDARWKALTDLDSKIKPLAQHWFDAYVASQNGSNPSATTDSTLAYPQADIESAVTDEAQAEKTAVDAAITANWNATAQNGAITEIAKQNMEKSGWIGIGSWEQTFAENNAALQSAATSSWLTPHAPVMNDNANDYVKSAMQTVGIAQSKAANAPQNDCFLSGSQTATGDCSVGQEGITELLSFISNGSGGEGMVNPITTAKNVGDWMLTLVPTVFIAKSALGAVGKSVDVAGKITSYIPIGGFLGKIVKNMVAGGLSSLSSLLLYIGLAMLVMGIVLSVYIPFIPFISWFSGLVSYFASALEGLAAAEVWAFSHLHAEGEGMGQHARQGYIYILNMLLRPGLMVLGYFFAIALSTLLGTFLVQQYSTALANVQGNTNTGLFIWIGAVAVFCIMLFGLVQSTFNLIHEVPDRVISWFGQGSSQGSFARGMDSEVKGQTQQMAQWSGRGAATMASGGASAGTSAAKAVAGK